VMLGDADRQESTHTWLGMRPAGLPKIHTWEVSQDNLVRPPRGTTHVVLDTPAGLHGKKLDDVMKIADRVIVPLQPSLFDIQASHAFVQTLLAHKRSGHVRLGVVGMRVREGTIATDQLRHFLDQLGVPVPTLLRDTQLYVQLAARGATLWDIAPSRAERDLGQWQPILDWLEAP